MAHNTGHCSHTATDRRWTLNLVVEFAEDRRAVAFERYMKSGSGVAFVSGISDNASVSQIRHRPRELRMDQA